MSDQKLISRVAAFKREAEQKSVRVNLYGPGSQAGQSLRRLVLFASLLVGGMLAGNQIDQQQREAVPAHEATSWQSEASADLSDLCPPGPASQQQEVQQQAPPEVKLIEVNYLGKKHLAIDEASRVRLTKEAAEAQGLASVGLNWQDLYAVISAETAWIPRTGMGKNGVQSHGLAQMEPNTAKALGVADPNNHTQAIFGAAALIKEAATWSKSKIAGLRLTKVEKDSKLREGISIYYNLSSAGRRLWNGLNASDLPIETQHHIRNVKDGRFIAQRLEARLAKIEKDQGQSQGRGGESSVLRAGAGPSAAAGGFKMVSGEALEKRGWRFSSVSVMNGAPGAAGAPGASDWADSGLCRSAKAFAASLAAQFKSCPPSRPLAIKADGRVQQFLHPLRAIELAKASAHDSALATGWRVLHTNLHRDTSFELSAMAKCLGSDGDAQGQIAALAQDQKDAEVWAASRGAKTDLQMAAAMSAYTNESALSCSRWRPANPLAFDSEKTLRSALANFLAIRRDVDCGPVSDAVLVRSMGPLDAGQPPAQLLEDALALYQAQQAQQPEQGDGGLDGRSGLHLGRALANAELISGLLAKGYSLKDVNGLYAAALETNFTRATLPQALKMHAAINACELDCAEQDGDQIRHLASA